MIKKISVDEFDARCAKIVSELASLYKLRKEHPKTMDKIVKKRIPILTKEAYEAVIAFTGKE